MMTTDTFSSPTEGDFCRMIESALRRAKDEALQKIKGVESEAIKAGAYGSNRLVFAAVEEVMPHYESGIQEAMRLTADFHQKHGMPIDGLLEIAKPKLDQYRAEVTRQVCRTGRNHSELISIVEDDFRKRLGDAMLDVRTGYVGGRTVRMPQLDVREQAFRLLKAIYDEAKRDFRLPVKYLDVGHKIGMSEADAKSAQSYLDVTSLTEIYTKDEDVRITPNGIVEVEEAMRDPDRKTQHFPPGVMNVVIGDINAPFQQGTTASTQSIQINEGVTNLLREIVSTIEENLGDLIPDGDTQHEVTATVDSLKPQLDAKSPNVPIIREALRGLRSIISRAATGALTNDLQSKIEAAFDYLGGKL